MKRTRNWLQNRSARIYTKIRRGTALASVPSPLAPLLTSSPFRQGKSERLTYCSGRTTRADPSVDRHHDTPWVEVSARRGIYHSLSNQTKLVSQRPLGNVKGNFKDRYICCYWSFENKVYRKGLYSKDTIRREERLAADEKLTCTALTLLNHSFGIQFGKISLYSCVFAVLVIIDKYGRLKENQIHEIC